MKEEAECLAEYLIGTTYTVNEMANQLSIDMDQFYAGQGFDYLYDIVDQCDICDCWRPVDELAYDNKKLIFTCRRCRV